MRIMAGSSLPARRHLGWCRRQFRDLFAKTRPRSSSACLTLPESKQEQHRITFKEYTDKVWHAYLPDVLPGQLYGYRVHGPYEPENGHRFNPSKVVLDPYAKLIGRELKWADEVFALQIRRSGGRSLV